MTEELKRGQSLYTGIGKQSFTKYLKIEFYTMRKGNCKVQREKWTQPTAT